MSKASGSGGKLGNVHPGEILREEFLAPLGKDAPWLAQELRLPANEVEELLDGKRPITPETALRLARFWDTSVELWMNLQAHYDLEEAHDRIAAELKAIRPYPTATAA
jgi:addiction module HigA family antidote